MTFWEFASNNPCTAIVLCYLGVMAIATISAGFGAIASSRKQ